MKFFTAVAALLLQVAWIRPSGASPNGEQACENHDFNKDECDQVGCCYWSRGKCWSSVGKDPCGNVLLEGYEGWKDGQVLWSDPPPTQDWEGCEKVTVVFGVAVCVTEQAWDMKSKCDFIINVFYQLLDNDQDGVPNDEKVVSELVQKGYLFSITSTQSDMDQHEKNIPNQVYMWQPTRAAYAIPNSCDNPVHRGASATDRSTWEAAVNTYNNMDCSNVSDETFEEVFHIINRAAARVYPEKWGESFDSDVGAEFKRLNGNCGWGFTNNWIDPSSGQCSGQYAYNDWTCREECIVVEGTYWAAITYVGGLYYLKRCDDVKNEWLMCTPDANMGVYPPEVQNAVSLQEGSPLLYEMMSDNTSEGHKWLPKIMPDGKYTGFDMSGNTALKI